MRFIGPPRPSVAIVLPHRESFDPACAGAVAMVVQRIAAGQSRYGSVVVGPPHGGAGFPGIAFRPVRWLPWLPLTPTRRYALQVAARLAPLPPGLIEVHNKPDVADWLARLLPGRPVTLFLHNDPRSMRGAQTPGARLRLLRRLARVVTVSEFVRRCLLEGVDGELPRPPVVIHNSLDLTLMPPPVPPGERDRVILFAGRVVPQKGPDVFIKACAEILPRLVGWRAEIIGADGFSATKPDSRFVAGLRPAAAAAGVVLQGHKPHAEVLRAMARAAIVVVPSRWEEPFGMTALEAMASGAALAGSGRGGLGEVIGSAGLLIDPDDPASVGGALLRLAGDAGLRARLGAAGQERAQRHFAASDAMAKLDDLRDGVTAALFTGGPPRPTP